ncbi:MAG: polysaccharide pyruvyl transferase family protein [Lawsonibacter sp.]
MAADRLAMYEQVPPPEVSGGYERLLRLFQRGGRRHPGGHPQSILEASGEVAVTVLSNDPDARPRTGTDRLDPQLPPVSGRCSGSALRRCDALLSGGGSLLQDRTSTRSLLYYLSIIQRCAELLGKPVMLYANGIGPVQKPSNRRRVRRAVERAALVTLRDAQLRPGAAWRWG